MRPASRPACPSAGTAPRPCRRGRTPPADRPATSRRHRTVCAGPAPMPPAAAPAPTEEASCSFSLSCGALQQRGELIRRHRLPVEEALYLVAAVAFEKMQLRVGLDALGDHLQVQRVSERNDRLREDAVLGLGAGADVAHEGAVDL